ncbi:hypothetical protein H5410_062926 [Solanum commersonii]|uniref:Uncharacterized protein n=1 Tax=Solanum commersonii TaxID=4109 RepID=A0A9J5WDS2_SOLCO|nr:hypothetical protein H5410_062926 [Solanum commersonii]
MAPKKRANKAKTNTSNGREILKLPVAIIENEKTKSPPKNMTHGVESSSSIGKKSEAKLEAGANIRSGVVTRGMIYRARVKAIDDECAKVKDSGKPTCKVKLDFDHL